MQLQIGHIFEGRYQIQDEIGRGGFGVVYRAFQVSMDRDVALKVLNPDATGAMARTAHERFLREVRIISKLRHPNTVTIHDFGESSNGLVYMVLEYVDGGTLKALLQREVCLDEGRAIHIAIQIAKSLSEAHRHQIVHRDLKPANIMLTAMGAETDFVKVLDFGVAHLKDNFTPELTNVGLPPDEREIIGTPRYMSPEQVRGHDLKGASDIYSLGLMLYEMLSGEPAVQGDTTMALITQQVSPTALAMPFLNNVNPRLAEIVRRATNKDVNYRYQSTDELVMELEQALIEVRHHQFHGTQSHFNPAQSQDMLYHGGYAHQSMNFQSNYHDPTPQPSGPFQTYPSGPQPMQPYQTGQMAPVFEDNTVGARPSNPPSHSMGAIAFEHQTPMAMDDQSPFGSQGSWNPNQSNPYSGPQQQQSWTKIINTMDGPQGHSSSQDFEPNLLEENQLNQPDPALAHLAPDLPPPPADAQSAFAPTQDDGPLELDRRPMNTQANPAVDPRPSQKSDPVGLLFQLVLTATVIVFLLAGYYIVFIVLGAALEKIVQGEVRFIGALVAGVIIPAVPLFAEGGKRERFKVRYRRMVRIRRALIVGFAGSVASIVIVSAIMPDQVVGELRSDPNWFFGTKDPKLETPLQLKNRAASYKVADVIEASTVKIGLMSKSTTTVGKDSVPEYTKPKSTRPAKKDAPKSVKTSTKKDSTSNKKTDTTKKPATRYRIGPAPTRPTNRFNTPKPTRPTNPKVKKQPTKKRTSTKKSTSKTDKNYVDW